MGNRKIRLYIGILITLTALALSVTVFTHNWYFSLLISVVGTIVTFFSLFERRETSSERIVLIAVLSALSVAGRVVFAPIASVQPSSFIIIMTGTVFGGEMGFMTGAITALASNLVLGQGPWTVWQMFCWGTMGMVSGLLSAPIRKSIAFRVIYSLLWGFVFGWVINLMYAFGGYGPIISAYIASFPFDLAHAISNAVLALLFGNVFIKKLSRIAVKYGLTTVSNNVQKEKDN